MEADPDGPRRPSRLRRWFGTGAAALLVGAALLAPAPAHADGPLREHAQARGFEIGAALGADHLDNDPDFARLAGAEFNAATAENAMKWESVQPSRGQFSWGGADAFMDFAEANGQRVRGHTLVWHSQLPSWVSDGGFGRDELRQVMREHIDAVAGRYAGRVDYWDVANEIFLGDGSWRNSVFYDTLGEDFVADALRMAHEADPNAELYLNDYSIDGINAKSDAYYELARSLLQQGVPLDGIGMQAHLVNGQVPGDMQRNIQRFADLGLDVAVTELDVRIPMPADQAELEQQARDYRQVVDACLAVERCIGVTVWGIVDTYSWVPDVFEGYGAPLLFDDDYRPKPAYDAVHDALAGGGEPDSEPPSAPGQPRVGEVGPSTVELSWPEAADNVGVARYTVHAGGEQVASATGTSTTVTGLQPETEYSFTVVAYDAAGNASDPSPPVAATTGEGAAPGPCEVDYTVPNEWAAGFTGEVAVTHNGSSALDGWELSWDFPAGQQVTSGWSGEWSQSGSTVTVSNRGWNGDVPPGGSVRVGFNASHTGSNPEPTAFTLNGRSCTVL